MSIPILVESPKTTSFEKDEEIINDNLSGPENAIILQNDASRKSSIKAPALRPEGRYGRAVSQPDEPAEVRMARYGYGGYWDDFHDHGSPIPSASARRIRRNSRRRSNHSLYGVSPNCKFGPKGFLVSTTTCSLRHR